MASILTDFAAAVARHPDRTCIIDGQGRATTFAALKSRADAFAQAWQAKGITTGDRVLLAMPVNADLYASLAALWSLGATVVLPEPAMGLAGLRHAAKTTKPKAFCSAGAYGILKYALPELWGCTHLRPATSAASYTPPAPPADDAIALISFTSGTTGAPKAIPRSHAFLHAQHHAIAPLLHSDTAQRDLVAFPVFVLINIASGQTSVLPNWKMSQIAKLTPAQLGTWITKQQVTRALIPPALCEKLTQTDIPDSLHKIFTGGGPVFPDLLHRLRAASQADITCVYGSTEAEPIAHLHARDITLTDHDAMTAGKGLLVGAPVPDLRLRITSHEIQVAGGHVNQGYLDPAHDTENKIKDGTTIWHRTGDAGYIDAQGRLWLLGRIGTDVSGVFPFSVEVAAQSWAGVTRAALTDGPRLVIAGDAAHLPDWETAARSMSIDTVIHIAEIPMDARHASKIDRAALRKKLA